MGKGPTQTLWCLCFHFSLNYLHCSFLQVENSGIWESNFSKLEGQNLFLYLRYVWRMLVKRFVVMSVRKLWQRACSKHSTQFHDVTVKCKEFFDFLQEFLCWNMNSGSDLNFSLYYEIMQEFCELKYPLMWINSMLLHTGEGNKLSPFILTIMRLFRRQLPSTKD